MSERFGSSAPNILDATGNCIRRTSEVISDSILVLGDAVWNHPSLPVKNNNSDYKEHYKLDVENAACDALRRGDVDEAIHQLRREIYLCRRLPGENNALLIEGSKKGLSDLHLKKSPKDVKADMVQVWAEELAKQSDVFLQSFD